MPPVVDPWVVRRGTRRRRWMPWGGSPADTRVALETERNADSCNSGKGAPNPVHQATPLARLLASATDAPYANFGERSRSSPPPATSPAHCRATPHQAAFDTPGTTGFPPSLVQGATKGMVSRMQQRGRWGLGAVVFAWLAASILGVVGCADSAEGRLARGGSTPRPQGSEAPPSAGASQARGVDLIAAVQRSRRAFRRDGDGLLGGGEVLRVRAERGGVTLASAGSTAVPRAPGCEARARPRSLTRSRLRNRHKKAFRKGEAAAALVVRVDAMSSARHCLFFRGERRRDGVMSGRLCSDGSARRQTPRTTRGLHMGRAARQIVSHCAQSPDERFPGEKGRQAPCLLARVQAQRPAGVQGQSAACYQPPPPRSHEPICSSA
jgi:hypothetical protein